MLKPDNTSYRWVVLIVAFITMVLGYAIRNCFSVFYPIIVTEFGWQRGDTALIFSFSIVIYGFIAPLAGGLVDRFRPRVILPIGAVLMGGGAALCSRATTQWEFYFFYGVMVAAGLSLSGWTPLTTIVSRWFVKKRGLAFLLGNICSFSSDRLGREKIFMPGCLLCAVSVLLLFFIKDASRPGLGFLSSILFGLGMGLAAPVFFTVVADLFSGRNFGSIQGTVIFGFSFGGAFSPWLAGFLHDKTGNYDITYLVLLVALCLCMMLMWFIAPHKLKPVAASKKR